MNETETIKEMKEKHHKYLKHCSFEETFRNLDHAISIKQNNENSYFNIDRLIKDLTNYLNLIRDHL